MKKLIFPSLMLVVSQAFSGGLGALGGLGKAMGEIADESTYNERQKQLMLQQHQLEMQRIEREFQLRAQAEERARQRSIETRKQEEIQIERAMESAHPGWRTTANSKAFLDWKDRQPASVRGLYESDRLADAMLMLDLFKRDTLVRSSR